MSADELKLLKQKLHSLRRKETKTQSNAEKPAPQSLSLEAGVAVDPVVEKLRSVKDGLSALFAEFGLKHTVDAKVSLMLSELQDAISASNAKLKSQIAEAQARTQAVEAQRAHDASQIEADKARAKQEHAREIARLNAAHAKSRADFEVESKKRLEATVKEQLAAARKDDHQQTLARAQELDAKMSALQQEAVAIVRRKEEEIQQLKLVNTELGKQIAELSARLNTAMQQHTAAVQAGQELRARLVETSLALEESKSALAKQRDKQQAEAAARDADRAALTRQCAEYASEIAASKRQLAEREAQLTNATRELATAKETHQAELDRVSAKVQALLAKKDASIASVKQKLAQTEAKLKAQAAQLQQLVSE